MLTYADETANWSRPLLSTAKHAADESHWLSAIQRGFEPVPEKRYALTQHSAQTLFRQQRQARGGGAAAGSAGSAGLISGDRWQRTGGYNPGIILLAFPSTKVLICLMYVFKSSNLLAALWRLQRRRHSTSIYPRY